jgi:hypothetical protein
MAEDQERLQLLFLGRPLERSERRLFGHPTITTPVWAQEPIAPTNPSYPPSLKGSLSSASTTSSKTRYSDSDTSSRRSATVTVASTVTQLQGHPQPTLDQLIAALPYDYGYDLPCEFGFIGCNLRFHPEHSEAWIDHTISHFSPGISPPLKSICIFCDTEFDCTASPLDARSIWRDRMLHISSHFEARVPSNYPRPDFFVIEHMHANGLISLADYTEAREYTERPHCDGLVPRDFQTEDMKRKKEKELQGVHDLDKEERTRRKETRHKGPRGKGKEEHEPSRKSTARTQR